MCLANLWKHHSPVLEQNRTCLPLPPPSQHLRPSKVVGVACSPAWSPRICHCRCTSPPIHRRRRPIPCSFHFSRSPLHPTRRCWDAGRCPSRSSPRPSVTPIGCQQFLLPKPSPTAQLTARSVCPRPERSFLESSDVTSSAWS